MLAASACQQSVLSAKHPVSLCCILCCGGCHASFFAARKCVVFLSGKHLIVTAPFLAQLRHTTHIV